MKKQKITKSLDFNKVTLADLKPIIGGNAPATMPVNTYRCEPTFGGVCGPDPQTNPTTCSCGGGGSSTSRGECITQSGVGCVLHTTGSQPC